MQKPNSLIRKISVGADSKTGMTYMSGQKVLNNEYFITLIQQEEMSGHIVVYIENVKKEVLLWKEFTKTVPISLEYFIEHEKPL